MIGNQMLFEVPDEILDVEESRNGREVKIYIWEVIFWVPEKSAVFWYCIGKLPEASGGFRRGSEVHKWVHHVPRAHMG